MARRCMVSLVPPVAALLALMAAGPTAAQINTQVYAVKFLCGFSDGRVPKINDPTPLPAPYLAVEPGNYGTVINIINLNFQGTSTSVSATVLTESSGQASLGGTILSPFQVHTIDCVAITHILSLLRGFPADGRFIEGYVRLDADEVPPLDVTVAYSYALQKADSTGIGLGSSLQVVHVEPRLLPRPPE
jgi:hypothetical protein